MTGRTAGAVTSSPIGFRVGDRAFTYRREQASVTVDDGLEGAETVVAMSDGDWSALVEQTRTFVNLYLAGDLTFERGGFTSLVEWDPLIKLVHSGVPIYDPSRVDLTGTDLNRTFTLDDPDDDIRGFLETAGYAHIRGVFDVEEMKALDAEVDRLAELATPGDDRSWWVTDAEDRQRLCRLVYAGERSELIAGMEADDRLARLGRILRPDLRPVSDRMEGTAVLLKVPGRTVGLSNIPWHQDCGMGGHSICCPSIALGVQITGSDAATGNLLVVPGSHGQTLHYDWQKRYADVPVVAVDTAPGDVTVHIADVMHASPEPQGAGGRRTMYVTFFPPTLWDHIGPGEAFNDLVRNRAGEAAALQEARAPSR